MTCLKCKDGFITSVWLGRVACLACRDARIDNDDLEMLPLPTERPKEITQNYFNPLGQHHFECVFIAHQGFAVWQVKFDAYSHHLMPPKRGHIDQLFDISGAPTEYRRWRWMEEKIGGWPSNIDVSHEFESGAKASIDKNWNVHLTLQCATKIYFKLTDDSLDAHRFRVAIKLPEPEIYT